MIESLDRISGKTGALSRALFILSARPADRPPKATEVIAISTLLSPQRLMSNSLRHPAEKDPAAPGDSGALRLWREMDKFGSCMAYKKG